MAKELMVSTGDMLYTVDEVAQIIKCGKPYVYKLIKAGHLPVLKLGHMKVRRESLMDFLANNEGKDLSDPYHVIDFIPEEI